MDDLKDSLMAEDFQAKYFQAKYFQEEVPWETREQILRYQASQCMSDTERAQFFGLPTGSRMRERAKILSPENLKLGKNCWIGEGAILDASGGLEIGEDTSIGLNVMLWTHDSHPLNIAGKNLSEHKARILRKPTRIGSRCFIGGPSVVMPGVTIGDQCVIAPMSVVYADLPDKTVYRPYENFLNEKARIDELERRLAELESVLAMTTKAK